MKDLRLLQIIPALESGGAEQGTIDVANFIAQKGFESNVVSNGGRMLNLLNQREIKHFKLPVHSKNPLIIYKNIDRIRKIILDNKINLVHVRSRAPAWTLYHASKKICLTSSTFHNVYGNQNFFKKYYNKGLSKVNNIVAISKYVKQSISNSYKIDLKKIDVIYRGVDTKFFNSTIKDELKYFDFIKRYNVPNNKKIILYPARLTKWKGQIEFLSILKSLNNKEVICYFIGDNKNKNYASKLEKEIYNNDLSTKCKILGHLSRENMRFMYKTSDLIINAPLQPEGFGRIISESFAMKKIVLCYNFGGAEEQISGLNSLYAIEPFNKNQMIEKINTALNLSENTIYQLGDVAREHVIKKFSKKIMLNKYMKFYNKIIL